MSIKEISLLSNEEKKLLELLKTNKISVSGVKHSKGHDMDCMECNLKIGNRIKGIVWDDSWGGGYQYFGEEVNSVKSIFKKISDEIGEYTSHGFTFKFSDDVIVDLLVNNFELKKQCKNKVVVYCVKETYSKDKYIKVDSFSYNCHYDKITEKEILEDFEKDGYVEIEIMNKRFI